MIILRKNISILLLSVDTRVSEYCFFSSFFYTIECSAIFISNLLIVIQTIVKCHVRCI